jgi:hypothetical protein
MVVTFRKSGCVCAWTALRSPRTRVPGPSMAAGRDLPHDLATFVIERGLEVRHGFWGCIADGATFRSLRRTRTPQGTAVIKRHVAELDDAERRVNEIYFAWREGRPTSVDADLDAMLRRWRALDDGGTLVVEWPLPRARTGPHRFGAA